MMVQPAQNILFVSDLSVNMKQVFEQAAALAVQQKANLIVLHVMEKDSRSDKRIKLALGEGLYQDLKSQQKEGARNILVGKNIDALKIKQTISGFFQGIDTENDDSLIEKILVAEGPSIADVITITAIDEDCSIIVLGCKQRRMLAEAMGDHLIRKILKRSPIPVLVIPIKEY